MNKSHISRNTVIGLKGSYFFTSHLVDCYYTSDHRNKRLIRSENNTHIDTGHLIGNKADFIRAVQICEKVMRAINPEENKIKRLTLDEIYSLAKYNSYDDFKSIVARKLDNHPETVMCSHEYVLINNKNL